MLTRLRTHVITAVVAVTMSVGGTAWANHQFSDVDDGSFFADSIEAIKDAGCASGYDDGTFRPDQPISRAQFAYWLTNCGGRAAHDAGNALLDTDDQAEEIAEVVVESGGVANSDRQFAVVVATYDVTTGGADLPCVVEFELSESGGGFAVAGQSQIVQIQTNTPSLGEVATGSMTMLVPVDAGHESTVEPGASRPAQAGCDSSLTVSGSAVMFTAPFGGFP